VGEKPFGGDSLYLTPPTIMSASSSVGEKCHIGVNPSSDVVGSPLFLGFAYPPVLNLVLILSNVGASPLADNALLDE